MHAASPYHLEPRLYGGKELTDVTGAAIPLLPASPSVPVSLSLSPTRTHTQIQTYDLLLHRLKEKH